MLESTFDPDWRVSPHTTPFILQLRFVCMSDTHCLTSHLQFEIPEGDVFVHAGDFTRCGSASEVEEFNSWIGELLSQELLQANYLGMIILLFSCQKS